MTPRRTLPQHAQALLTRFETGTFFRNLGRPVIDAARSYVRENEDGVLERVDVHKYPLSTANGGHIVAAREEQQRCYDHLHICSRPAAPRPEWLQHANEGDEIPWVDAFTCGRVPSLATLRAFDVLLTCRDAKLLVGVCPRPAPDRVYAPGEEAQAEALAREAAAASGVAAPPSVAERTAASEPHATYAYLRGAALDAVVVHPDIARDFGGDFAHPALGPNRLLRELITLVSGEGLIIDAEHHPSGKGCEARAAPAITPPHGGHHKMTARFAPAQVDIDVPLLNEENLARIRETPRCVPAANLLRGVVRARDVAPHEWHAEYTIMHADVPHSLPPGAAGHDAVCRANAISRERAACASVGGMFFVVDVRLDDGATTLTLSHVPRVALEVTDASDPPADHYSLHPYSHQRKPKGKMIHRHHRGVDVPDQYCAEKSRGYKCSSYYPKKVTAVTTMGPNGFIDYRRAPADFMVVPWNAWASLYFTSHINVELIANSARAIRYMHKILTYVTKGDQPNNRAQVVPDGDVPVGAPPDFEDRTHHRDDHRDEVAHYFAVKQSSAPTAYHTFAGGHVFDLLPACTDIYAHIPRRVVGQNKQDTTMSEWEKYLARPSLTGADALVHPEHARDLDSLRVEPFFSQWLCSPHGLAPSPRGDHADRRLSGAPWYTAKDGRTVFLGADPNALRLPNQRTFETSKGLLRHWYWRRRTADVDEEDVATDATGVLFRLGYVPITRGAAYYVRLLARHRPARSYADLLTDDDGARHETPQAACRALALLDEDEEARSVILLAIDAGDPPSALRSLFVQARALDAPPRAPRPYTRARDANRTVDGGQQRERRRRDQRPARPRCALRRLLRDGADDRRARGARARRQPIRHLAAARLVPANARADGVRARARRAPVGRGAAAAARVAAVRARPPAGPVRPDDRRAVGAHRRADGAPQRRVARAPRPARRAVQPARRDRGGVSRGRSGRRQVARRADDGRALQAARPAHHDHRADQLGRRRLRRPRFVEHTLGVQPRH